MCVCLSELHEVKLLYASHSHMQELETDFCLLPELFTTHGPGNGTVAFFHHDFFFGCAGGAGLLIDLMLTV